MDSHIATYKLDSYIAKLNFDSHMVTLNIDSQMAMLNFDSHMVVPNFDSCVAIPKSIIAVIMTSTKFSIGTFLRHGWFPATGRFQRQWRFKSMHSWFNFSVNMSNVINITQNELFNNDKEIAPPIHSVKLKIQFVDIYKLSVISLNSIDCKKIMLQSIINQTSLRLLSYVCNLFLVENGTKVYNILYTKNNIHENTK